MNESILTDAKRDTFIPPYIPPPDQHQSPAFCEPAKKSPTKVTTVLVLKPAARTFYGLVW